MSFQDPFASDLKGFRFDPNAPATRTGATSAPLASAQTTSAGASRPAAAAAATGRPQPAFWGTQQSFTFGQTSAPVTPPPAPAGTTMGVAPGRLGGVGPAPTAAGAPVAGRRAAQTTVDSPVAMSGGRAGPFPGPSTAAAAPPPPTTTTSALDWLDEPVVSRRAAAPRADPQQGHQPGRMMQGTSALSPHSSSSAGAAATALSDGDPLSFLDPDAGRRAPVAAYAGPTGTLPGVVSTEDELVARAQAARLEAAQRAQVAKAAKEAQLRDLYASLDALDMEIDQTTAKLDTQAIKEEAELTELETALVMKQHELRTQETQVADKVAAAQHYGESQSEDMHRRFAVDCAAMRREVQDLEGGRQKRRLVQLQEMCQSQETVLRQLRRQRDLIAQMEPFGADGIRIAVAMSAAEEAVSDSAAHEDDGDDSASEHDDDGDSSAQEAGAGVAPTPPAVPAPATTTTAGAGHDAFDDFFNEFPDLAVTTGPTTDTEQRRGSAQAATSSPPATSTNAAATPTPTSTAQARPLRGAQPSQAVLLRDTQARLLRDPTVEEAISAAVQLLQRYVASHLSVVRDEVVDCVHDETQTVAHETRLTKMDEWSRDTLARRKHLSAHVLSSMEANRERARARDEQESARLRQLHEILQEGRDAVRVQSRTRLADLQASLMARLAYATKAFASEAEQTWKLVERELRCTLDGDAAMATAQNSEVEQRLAVERRVRRQLYATQRDALGDQLAQMKRKSEARYQAQLQALLASARTLSGRDSVGELRARLQEMRELMEQQRHKLRQDVARRADGRDELPDDAADSPHTPSTAVENRMHLQELRHQLQTLLAISVEASERVCAAQQETQQTRARLGTQLKDGVLASLRERRSAQQSHSTQIECTRRLWEREHRQCLQASHTLEVLLRRRTGSDGSPSSVSSTNSPLSTLTTAASAVAETRVHPQDVSLTLLLEALCERLGQTMTQSNTQRESRRAVARDVQEQRETVHAHYGEVQLLWATLYEQLLRIHEEQKSLSTQTAAVTEETARLESERDRIAAEADSLEKRSAACRHAGAEVREAYTTTLDEYQRRQRELDALAEEQLTLAQEQNLVQLQGGGGGQAYVARGGKAVNTTPDRSGAELSEEESGLSPEQPQPRGKRNSDDDVVGVSRDDRDDKVSSPRETVESASAHTASQEHHQSATPPTNSATSRPATTKTTTTTTAARPHTSTHRTPPRQSRPAEENVPAPSHGREQRGHAQDPLSPLPSPVAVNTSVGTNGSAAAHETSGVSATSLFRSSFMDLISVLESTGSSF